MYNSCSHAEKDEVNPLDLTFASDDQSNENPSTGFTFSLVKPHAL